MEKTIGELKVILKTVNTQKEQTQYAIYNRTQFLRRLYENIRQGKKATAAVHRASLSSRSNYVAIKEWRALAKQCEDIIFTQKAALHALNFREYSLKQAIEALEEH